MERHDRGEAPSQEFQASLFLSEFFSGKPVRPRWQDFSLCKTLLGRSSIAFIRVSSRPAFNVSIFNS